MPSPLENLCKNAGPLAVEPPNAAEFARLCASADRSLNDARVQDISLDSRFLMAYGAAHSYCTAAMRYRGYRPRHRYIVFQALPHTLGLPPEVWRILDNAHQRRNVAEYEGDFAVSEQFVRDMIAACQSVAIALKALPPLATNGK